MIERLLPTIVNTLTVLFGASIGLWLHGRFPERFRSILFQAIGLITLLIGMRDALGTQNIPFLALSVILGGLVGEWIDIEGWLESVGGHLQHWMNHSGESKFVEGFVDASVLFCVGAMTIVGSLRAGVAADGEILYTKAMMDGNAAVVLAGALGSGVLVSALTVFFMQSALTIFFMFVGQSLPEPMITEISAAGGLMILGIGINLLKIGKIKVGNLLPGMLFAALFSMW